MKIPNETTERKEILKHNRKIKRKNWTKLQHTLNEDWKIQGKLMEAVFTPHRRQKDIEEKTKKIKYSGRICYIKWYEADKCKIYHIMNKPGRNKKQI